MRGSSGGTRHHNLIAALNDKRGTTAIVNRSYEYNALGIPTNRTIQRQGTTRQDTFTHNDRSELTAATMGNDSFSYDYDNVGNRKVSTEKGETTVYDSNELNQYTAENEFVPQFDADGNQTLVKTGTGIWEVTYNALNRPTCFTRTNADDSVTTVTAAYDYMGRRVFKQVVENGATTLHQRYLYRGHLQIAALDFTRPTLNALWFITWDPTEPIATRPLAIQKDGTWYTCGLDLTKNVMEVYTTAGYLATAYTYSPFGKVTVSGNVSQPIQWSCEFYDSCLSLVYYNYRYLNLCCEKWTSRDPISNRLKTIRNLYNFTENNICNIDFLGEFFGQRSPFMGGIIVNKTSKPCCKDCENMIQEVADNIGNYFTSDEIDSQHCRCELSCATKDEIQEAFKNSDPNKIGGYEKISSVQDEEKNPWWKRDKEKEVVSSVRIACYADRKLWKDFLIHEIQHAVRDCSRAKENDVIDDIMCKEIEAYSKAQIENDFAYNERVEKVCTRAIASVKTVIENNKQLSQDRDLMSLCKSKYDSCAEKHY